MGHAARAVLRLGAVLVNTEATVECVQGLAAAAIVGHANWKLGDRVLPVLEAWQAASPNRFQGMCQAVGWEPYPGLARDIPGALSTAGYRRLSQAYSPSERAAMFHDTAARVYRIDVS